MEKIVTIDGKEYRMVANGATPRVYRSLFKKEVFTGVANAIGNDNQINDAEVFENLAYCMGVQGGSIPTSKAIEDWLGEMSSPLAVINAAPDIIALWSEETETTSTEKKE